MKKTFEITFTKKDGIYHANLIKAETAEQATAYFEALETCKVVGCTETNEPAKPGQPMHEVTDEWAAQETQRRERKHE